MFKPKNSHERIDHRLKISLGHLKKVIQMVEDHEYCINVLHQSLAVQKALREVDALILENHLKTCTVDAIKRGEKGKVIKEIITILKKSS